MSCVDVFVPGRLAILGEHTDWAARFRDENPCISVGRCLVCTTNEGLFAKTKRLNDDSVCEFTYSHTPPDGGDVLVFRKLLNDVEGFNDVAKDTTGFFAYVAGTVAAILEAYPSIIDKNGGIMIDNYKTTLPMKKGLSSSASLCTLIVKCFDQLYNLTLSHESIMTIALTGERKTGSQCGLMDFCVTMGSGIGLMTISGKNYFKLDIINNKNDINIVVADMNSSKDTVGILNALNSCYPIPTKDNDDLFHDYVTKSQYYTLMAVQALEREDSDSGIGSIGDSGSGNNGGNKGLHTLAKCMKKSQYYFDKAGMKIFPQELNSPILHEIMNDLTLNEIALAIKGVGSQGDGTVQVLCENKVKQELVLNLLENEFNCNAFKITVPAATATASSSSSPVMKSFNHIKLALIEKHQQQQQHIDSLCVEMTACGVEYIAVIDKNQNDNDNGNDNDDTNKKFFASKDKGLVWLQQKQSEISVEIGIEIKGIFEVNAELTTFSSVFESLN
jgi:galactokinase